MSHEKQMQQCIQDCSDCHNICLSTLFHCLKEGGAHAAADHIVLLLDCAETCSVSSKFMLWESPHHQRTCSACAELCLKCADSCRKMEDDKVMQECADMCEKCAESCRLMAA